jgi:tetratricopeptide (TPR) repeat protein
LFSCLSLATLTRSASADIDLDRVVFDAYPLPASDTVMEAPHFPTQPQIAAQPIATRMAEEINLPLNPEPEIAAAAVVSYQDSLDSTQNETSPYDQSLLEQYLSLGLSYQQLGDHEEALAALEKAEYISRINNGLHAPEQYRIIERMIASYVAEGRMSEADDKRQYLYYLSSQQYGEDSLEVVPSLTALADWNMSTFDHALSAGNNVGFISGNNDSLDSFTARDGTISRVNGTRMFTPRGIALSNLYSAQVQYHQAIVNLLRPRRADAARLDQLTDLELRFVEAVFLGAYRDGILEDPVFYMSQRVLGTGSRVRQPVLSPNLASFRNGRAAYERMRIYQQLNPKADAVAKVLPTLGLGDWNLLYNRRERAMEQYQAAALQLHEAGVPQERIAALLEPEVPVQLPEFAPRPNSRRQFGIEEDSPLDYDGWIDVHLRISRFGAANQVDILAKSDNVTRELERRLNRVIRNSPFRPSLSAALANEAQEFTLRYYFKELPESALR